MIIYIFLYNYPYLLPTNKQFRDKEEGKRNHNLCNYCIFYAHCIRITSMGNYQ